MGRGIGGKARQGLTGRAGRTEPATPQSQTVQRDSQVSSGGGIGGGIGGGNTFNRGGGGDKKLFIILIILSV